MQAVLSEDVIQAALAELNGWRFEQHAIHREYTFATFTEAMGFVTEMAFACEKANHHPELFNVYNKIQIRLTTHDAGNQVTDKDLNLARAIESIAKTRLS